MTGLGDLAAVAGLGLALSLAAPALAAPIEINPEPLHRDAGNVFVLVLDDGQQPIRRPIDIVPWQSPPPADLQNAVVALRLSCPRWRDGMTAGFESEAHVCAVLAGHDPAYEEGAIAASWMTAAVLGGLWLVLRLPDWLASILAPVRRRRNWP